MPITYKVEYAMTKDLVAVDVQTEIREAIKLMVSRDIGSIIITKNDKPVGIITERDISKRTCILEKLCEMKVKEIMSSPLITVDRDTAIGKAAERMNEKNIRRLLVTKDEEIKGIVTQKDLMKATLEVLHTLLHVETGF